MNTTNQSQELRNLIEVVTKDARSLRSTYPHQMLFALADSRVREALERRFAAGNVLLGLESLPGQRETGLIPVCFSFAPSAKLQMARDCVLVHLDYRCQVVSVIEDFEPVRPNPITGLAPRDPLPVAVTKSKDGRLTRTIPPDVLRQMQAFELDLLIHHGVLSEIESQGIDVIVELATECAYSESFEYDTNYIAIDVDTGEIIGVTLTDYGTYTRYMVDDGESTTLDDFFDRFG